MRISANLLLQYLGTSQEAVEQVVLMVSQSEMWTRMIYQSDSTLPGEVMEQIAQQETDYLPDLIQVLVNAAMQIEHQK